jgi:hypothetical protein
LLFILRSILFVFDRVCQSVIPVQIVARVEFRIIKSSVDTVNISNETDPSCQMSLLVSSIVVFTTISKEILILAGAHYTVQIVGDLLILVIQSSAILNGALHFH